MYHFGRKKVDFGSMKYFSLRYDLSFNDYEYRKVDHTWNCDSMSFSVSFFVIIYQKYI